MNRAAMSCLAIFLLCAPTSGTSGHGAPIHMYLVERPNFTLEQALPIATQAAKSQVHDFGKFALNSVGPRVFKGDKKGQHWQFVWQELPFRSNLRFITVRVYMNDGSARVEVTSE